MIMIGDQMLSWMIDHIMHKLESKNVNFINLTGYDLIHSSPRIIVILLGDVHYLI